MIKRNLVLPINHSFFLFGPRQTGKSTLLRSTFSEATSLYYDLLLSEEYLRLSANPSLFREEVRSRKNTVTHIIVDEIQRIPQLLNEIHALLEQPNHPHFVLSGSSARKLKRSHANLLAGRAWTFNLYPFTHKELGTSFALNKALSSGTLPSVYLAEDDYTVQHTLKAYVETYIEEEIKAEALTRNLGAFFRFLTLAGDESGTTINFSHLARETGVTLHTVKEFFQILEDTLLGFYLHPFVHSSRKKLTKHPKFYLFDTGVLRALNRKTSVPLLAKTQDYGKAFEQFLITEILRIAHYKEKDYRFSFYRSSTHMEVDLIIETPENKIFAIEIKATDQPTSSMVNGLVSFASICPKAHLYCVCLTPHPRTIKNIPILPWQAIFPEIDL